MTAPVAEPWTITRILDWVRKDFAGKGMPSPRLDAELLLAHVMGLKRIDLYVRFEQPLQQEELARVRARLASGEKKPTPMHPPTLSECCSSSSRTRAMNFSITRGGRSPRKSRPTSCVPLSLRM